MTIRIYVYVFLCGFSYKSIQNHSVVFHNTLLANSSFSVSYLCGWSQALTLSFLHQHLTPACYNWDGMDVWTPE